MGWLKKYPRIVAAVLILVAGIWFAAFQARQKALDNATETKLTDEPRSGMAVESDFYYNQLTVKEMKVYTQMQERLNTLKGGVVEFEEPLNGREYLRITTALENEGDNYFYGFYEIPMTADNIYVKHKNADMTTIRENVIAKAILFVSCAEGVNEAGQYAEDGRVENLEEIRAGLSVNHAEKEAEIQKMAEETETLFTQIVEAVPAEYGEKRTVDYFLQWISENISPAPDFSDTSFSGMGDVIEGVYIYNSHSSAVMKQATPLGYARILSALCNKAGMESHIVLGKWGKTKSTARGYVLCAIQMNGQTIYVDASGQKASELAGHRYMTETEAMNHMSFVDYFEYE